MTEISLTMRIKLPDKMTDFQKKLFIGNLIVTWRALVEDSLHEEVGIPLVETHKYIGEYEVKPHSAITSL